MQDTHQFEERLVEQQKSMNTNTIGIGGSAVDDKTEKSIEEIRRSLESRLISMGNGISERLTREIPSRAFHVSVPYAENDKQNQSTIIFPLGKGGGQSIPKLKKMYAFPPPPKKKNCQSTFLRCYGGYRKK